MNLTEMTLDDMQQLENAIAMIKDGAKILSRLPLANDDARLTISLVPGREAVVRTGWIMPAAMEFGAPPPFVIEPMASGEGARDLPTISCETPAMVPCQDAGVISEVSRVSESEAVPFQPCPTPAQPLPNPAQPPAQPCMTAAPPAIPPLKSGPLADDERAAIWALHAQGKEPREIATAIGRRLNMVASVLHNSKKKTTGQPVQAGDTTPAPAASTSSPVVAMDAKPETPAAGAEVPSADTGEPAREREAGVTAPKAGGAAPDFSFDQRRINAWLGGLGYRRGWNAQRDLDLVDALGRGLKFAEACADLGYDPRDAKVRWDELTRPICPDGRSVRLSGQADLLLVLRHRAGEA